MVSTIKSNILVQPNGHPALQVRFYRPSDWEQVKRIFVAGVRAPLALAVGHMYTWPWLYPAYGLVCGGLGWLGRVVWNAADRLGLRAFRMAYPWGWVRLAGRGVIKDWSWKESAALGSIGLGLVTWGVIRWKVARVFHGYAQMSLESDLKDILEHYQMERVPLLEPNGPNDQGACEDWRPKGASAFWVAEIGDEVAGCISLDQRGDGPYVAAGELRRMSVSSRFHRRGIASRLLERLIDHAKMHGLKVIYLHTTQYQTAAIALYKKAGFKFVKDAPLLGPSRILMFKLDL